MGSQSRARPAIALALALLVGGGGCVHTVWQASLRAPTASDLDREAPFVKVHTVDGKLYVLERWTVDEAAGEVRGRGLVYSERRTPTNDTRAHTIPLDRVALLETTRPERVTSYGRLSVMGALLGIIGAIAIYGLVRCKSSCACGNSCF